MSLEGRRFWDFPVDKAVLKGHTLEIDQEKLEWQTGSTSPAILQLVEDLNAEMARLMRLSPDAPPGYHWEYETQQHEDLIRYKINFRVVARLKEN